MVNASEAWPLNGTTRLAAALALRECRAVDSSRRR